MFDRVFVKTVVPSAFGLNAIFSLLWSIFATSPVSIAYATAVAKNAELQKHFYVVWASFGLVTTIVSLFVWFFWSKNVDTQFHPSLRDHLKAIIFHSIVGALLFFGFYPTFFLPLDALLTVWILTWTLYFPAIVWFGLKSLHAMLVQMDS